MTTRRYLMNLPGVPGSALAGVVGGGFASSAEARQVIDSYERAAAEADSAAGAALVKFGPVPQGRVWLVQRYLVAVEGAPGSVASVYIGNPATINLVDGTAQGDLDVGAGDPPLIVPGGDVLTFEWAGAGDGNRCIATVQYLVARLER